MQQMMMKQLKEMEKELDEELPERDVEREKQQLINQLKGLKKEDIISKPENYTLWKRIKRTIGF
jgi:hypothetical protein